MKNKQGFTMLELVFILVILGILAAIAIPKISASRDDAKLVAFKSDVSTLTSSFPAHFLAQGQGNFSTAVALNTANWVLEEYVINTRLKGDNNSSCITAKLLRDDNGTQAVAPQEVKFLQISTATAPSQSGNLCQKLVFELNLSPNSPISIALLSNSIVF